MEAPPDLQRTPAPTLILLHGACLNGAMWIPVRRHLAPYWQVLAPDLPGHGSRQGERFTLEAAIATVAAAARSIAPSRVIVVGDSLGAYTAMAAAATLPAEQLAGLVLAGATYDFRGWAARSAAMKGRVLALLAALVGEARFVRRTLPKALGPQGFGLAPADATALIDAGMSVVAFGQAVAAIRGRDWLGTLAAIDVPALIANGDEDAINVAQEASFLAAAHDATSYRFKGCKHGVSLWRPAEFGAIVNEFAKRILGSNRP